MTNKNNMLEQLNRLEAESRQLDRTPKEFADWMDLLKEFGAGFLADIPREPVFFHGHNQPALHQTIPVEAQSLETALKEFGGKALPTGINTTSGRFFGYVPGGGLPSAAVGDFLAALTNRYSGVYQAGPGAAEIENITTRWLLKMVDYPKGAWGTLQSGGTLATLTAVIAARETRPIEEWRKGVIYYSEEIHNAILKSIKIAGLSQAPARKIPTDSEFRMDAAALEAQIQQDLADGLQPWIVFCSAGTVNTGAVDPLEAISRICRRHSLWLHVDAAYGGFFMLTESGSWMKKWFAEADSLVLDPHKGLFLPYGCGAVLVKEGKWLREALSFHADYLADVQDLPSPSPSDYSPELTRHFRAMRLWLSLKVNGLNRFKAALEEKLLLAQYAYDRLRDMPEVELGPEPQLSCVTFRLKADEAAPDAQTEALLETLLERGRVLLSSTRLNGRVFLRICILCFRSHHEDVDVALEEISRFISGQSD